MNLRLGTKIGLSKEMDFVVLLAAWFIFGSLFRTHHPHSYLNLFHAWVLLTSGLSMIVLNAIGYFDHYIPKPQMSSVASLIFALPLSAFVSKWLLMLTSHIPPIRYSEAFRAAVWTALAFELLQLAIFKMHRALGRKWSLSTHLDARELEALVSQIEKSGASWWIRVLPARTIPSNGGVMRGDETVVISRKAVRHLKDHPELLAAHLRGQRIVDVGQLLKEFRGRVNLDRSDAWTFLLASTYQNFLIRLYFYVKGIVEVVLAIMLLVLLSPLFILLAVSILVTSGWPVIYRQERLGYRGQIFSLYKFRTMAKTAEMSGPQWAVENDPRASVVGRWLRKMRLDELPQLINVIQGDLSFVGPRPERPEFHQILSEKIPLFSLRLLVRPGITGWAQVRQGYASSVEECKTKLEYDFYYVQNMSPRLDMAVMLHTAAMMFRGNSGR